MLRLHTSGGCAVVRIGGNHVHIALIRLSMGKRILLFGLEMVGPVLLEGNTGPRSLRFSAEVE